MSSSRFPERDLRLEALQARNAACGRPLGEIAQTASPFALVDGLSSAAARAAREALIDAVFCAPGAAEWLRALRLAVAELLADKEPAPVVSVSREAIRTADANPGRRP
jgi:hypothetical protein